MEIDAFCPRMVYSSYQQGLTAEVAKLVKLTPCSPVLHDTIHFISKQMYPGPKMYITHVVN